MKNYSFFALFIAVFIFFGCPFYSDPSFDPDNPNNPNNPDNPDNSELVFNREQVIKDMFTEHEGKPHGVPTSWDWAIKPNEATYGIPPSGYNYATAWGQVYAEKNLPDPDVKYPNVRVHLKDLQLYIYYSDKTWKLVQNEMNPAGLLYVEDYKNDKNKETKIVKESGGGISIQAGSGWNFHFFPDEFAKLSNRNNIVGTLVVCKARLLGPENDAKNSKYILSVGGDYWKDEDSSWNGNDENNTGIGLGRFKYITTKWQYFTMHSFKEADAKNIVFPLE